jgi:hypothetical protein
MRDTVAVQAPSQPTSDFGIGDHLRRHDWPILTSRYFDDIRDLHTDRLTQRIAWVNRWWIEKGETRLE